MKMIAGVSSLQPCSVPAYWKALLCNLNQSRSVILGIYIVLCLSYRDEKPNDGIWVNLLSNLGNNSEIDFSKIFKAPPESRILT